MKALDPLAKRNNNRTRSHSMKALGPLAVAEPDILAHSVRSRLAPLAVRIEALPPVAPRTARIGPAQRLRSLRSPRPGLALSVRQESKLS
jgi:hypothetical protein